MSNDNVVSTDDCKDTNDNEIFSMLVRGDYSNITQNESYTDTSDSKHTDKHNFTELCDEVYN